MKKILLFIIMLLSIQFCNVVAYANSSERLEVIAYNFENNNAYIDLLIKMSDSDEFYINYNEPNMKQFNFNTENISNFCDNEGYVSFSCHYKDVLTEMEINPIEFNGQLLSRNCFTLKKYENGNVGQDIYVMKKLFDKQRKFKIAILDENGNITKVSDEFDIINDSGYLEYEINYDIANNEVQLEWYNYNNIVNSKISSAVILILIILMPILVIFYIFHHLFKKNKKMVDKGKL